MNGYFHLPSGINKKNNINKFKVAHDTDVVYDMMNKMILSAIVAVLSVWSLTTLTASTTHGDDMVACSTECCESHAAPSAHADRTCRVCSGTGLCRTCNGKGTYFDSFSGKRLKCPNCWNGKCTSCGGTGRIPTRD